jgi:hypothetical protein
VALALRVLISFAVGHGRPSRQWRLWLEIEYERMQREPAGKFCVVPQADLQEAFPERLSQ